MFKAYKIDLTGFEAEEIQKHAFNLGYYWEHIVVKNGTKYTPQHLDATYLLLNDDGSIFYDNDLNDFKESTMYEEISPLNFLKLGKNNG